MSKTADALIAEAQQLADDVLFPRSLDADVAAGVPETQLQALADAGFYGISTQCSASTIAAIIEAFASGCLTTTFVWTQHLGASAAAHFSDGPVRNELAAAMAAGAVRGGVAFAHMLRPGTPMTVATPTAGGWLYSGSAPWVTGWGHINVVHAAARHGDDIVWALIDAQDSATLSSTQINFAVVNATQTDVLAYDDHFVPSSRVTKVENFEAWKARYRLGLRSNGSLALGVAARCCALLGDAAFDRRLVQARETLNTTDPADVALMSKARAAASLLAVNAATALVAQTGGSAVMLSDHAQRLMREAMFVLVQGQTPGIKAELLQQLES